jgi:hypothetical protein
MGVAAVGIICLTSGCGVWGRLLEPGGSREVVNAQVQFIGSDNRPITLAKTYIVERIATDMVITSVVITDFNGGVNLHGSYCLPMFVAIQGAYVTIKSGNILPVGYRQRIQPDGGHPLSELFGVPDPRDLELHAHRLDCG